MVDMVDPPPHFFLSLASPLSPLMVNHRDLHECSSNDPTHHRTKKSGFSLPDFFRVYKLAFCRWRHHKKSFSSSSSNDIHLESNNTHQEPNSNSQEPLGQDKHEEETMNGIHNHNFKFNGDGLSPKGFFQHRSMDNFFASTPSFGRSRSRQSPSPVPSFLYRNGSRRSTDTTGFPDSFSRSGSRRSTNHPIFFSNSSGRIKIKPPPIEKLLECTLEELCYGCTKKIKITRDVTTDSGQLIQEEEILRIKVKPGWKKGTKITFEGMGNETPAACPADIIFVIAEKRHLLFRRDDDNLELVVELPLVKALTGCTIPIPLLGGDKVSLKMDDIIHPGYERIIPGQGMPNPKEGGERGHLKVVFLIGFPTELKDQQRADIVSILEDSR